MRKFQFRRRLPGRPAFFNTFLVWTVISSALHLLLIVFYGLRRYGKHRIPQDGPAIYVANHQSNLDPVIVGVLIADRPFTSLARSGLFSNKFFGAMIRWFGAVPIEQGKGDMGAIKVALNELQAGRRILIFPEGSRSIDGTLDEFQRGVVLLMKRAKVPVIPVALDGAYDVWPRHRRFPSLTGRLAVMADHPIDPEELLADGPDAALEKLRRKIETMRLELRRELRRCTGGRRPLPGLADKPYWQRSETANQTL